MDPNEYLDAAKQKRGLKSDYELAQELETTTGCISNYRHGRSIPDAYTMARLAEMIEGDPMTAIAAAEAKRAKSEKARKFWKNLLSTAALLAIMPAVHTIATVSVCILCKIANALPGGSEMMHSRPATA